MRRDTKLMYTGCLVADNKKEHARVWVVLLCADIDLSSGEGELCEVVSCSTSSTLWCVPVLGLEYVSGGADEGI